MMKCESFCLIDAVVSRRTKPPRNNALSQHDSVNLDTSIPFSLDLSQKCRVALSERLFATEESRTFEVETLTALAYGASVALLTSSRCPSGERHCVK